MVNVKHLVFKCLWFLSWFVRLWSFFWTDFIFCSSQQFYFTSVFVISVHFKQKWMNLMTRMLKSCLDTWLDWQRMSQKFSFKFGKQILLKSFLLVNNAWYLECIWQSVIFGAKDLGKSNGTFLESLPLFFPVSVVDMLPKTCPT